ncbi:hypothetical protein SUGI_0581880 [Cryptomeria japonica]|uniref:uncharacterized protein LOC131048050 n=1 Tax=Cryptomeria japonica TaxID=3369 RepID=UPI002414CF23|nr:uncharacterized protein LOC131048050 [Cryptomeria japonica]GLJ29520.1 hypothetical protein SUGI_0581880 [Cryptomeria japonica]
MTSLIVLRSVAFLCAFAAIANAADSSGSIQPPIGNKLFIILKGRGVQVYQCQQNLSYTLDHATADLYGLMDFRYLYPKGQHYFLAYADGQGGKPTWSYFGEQSRTTSTVTGKVIGRKEELDTIPDLLLQATSHSGPGAFDKISYVSRSKSKGGVAPTGCNNTGEIIQVNYEAFYSFYIREMSKPVSLPLTLSISNTNVPVKSYFGQGMQIYCFNGSAWNFKNVSAELSSVPGQEVIGKHYFLGEPDQYGGQPTWETFMPYSRVTAKLQTRVVVDPNSVPWLSLQATTHMGSIYLLTSVSYVQRVSTTGGKPPESINGARIGDIYMSPYTALYWFYAPQRSI